APTHPSRPGPAAQPSRLDHEIERLRQALRAGAEARLIAAKQALALASSYPLRRSRGARRTGVALSEEVATEAPELAAVAQQTAAWLHAEGDLMETSGEATVRACRHFIELADQVTAHEPRLASLVHSGLAHALIQLATHFPAELGALDLDAPTALEQALALAEQAIAYAPQLPDGHTALGRLLLCHDDPQAWTDAAEVLAHALALDPEHDPAEVALAVTLHAQGQTQEAREHVEQVLRRGSGQAQPLLLRALLALDSGHLDDARRDLTRAARIAPRSGLVQLDLARAAEAAGDTRAARAHHERAKELLGAASEAVRRALAGAKPSQSS
ncbi:MAG: tetratricopeptide repeat protein, partial [Deltaproteobacteria bacterium]|nr:tetratricopeptide repeat protein [Deltaproteobacteria bacterium]